MILDHVYEAEVESFQMKLQYRIFKQKLRMTCAPSESPVLSVLSSPPLVLDRKLREKHIK